MFIVVVLLIVALLVYTFYASVEWRTHLEMTKNQKVDYGWGSFNDFKREFDKYEWSTNGWKESVFDRNNNCEFHASIVVFNGKGMLLKSPIDWYKTNVYVKRYIKDRIADDRVTNYDWSK